MRLIFTSIILFYLLLCSGVYSAYGQAAEVETSTYAPLIQATHSIKLKNGFAIPANSQFIGEIVPPGMPPMPTITNNCGNSVLTAGTPQVGSIYYFQTAANGESTANPATLPVSVSGTYYLRARSQGGLWSLAREVTVTVTPVPANPTGPPVITSNEEDIAVLTAPAAPSGITYYFQLQPGGKDTFRQSPFSVTESGTYYLRAKNNLLDCWSEGTTSVQVTIVPSEAIPTEPNEPRNYITENSILTPGKFTAADLENLTIKDLHQTTTFFDGMGRPIQSVITQESPTRLDMVMAMAYEPLNGRQTKNYLPFSGGNDGKFKTNAIIKTGDYTQSDQYLFYQNTPGITSDTKPFASVELEASPLDIIEKAGAPGKVWNPLSEGGDGKTVAPAYRTNTDTDDVHWFVYNQTTDGTLGTFSEHALVTAYPAGSLMVSELKDEDNNQVFEFTNKSGQVIMKRAVLSANDFVETYYLYDDFGQLRYVLPPQLVEIMQENEWEATAAQLTQYVYIYNYDARKRLIEKKVPGASAVYMVYNRRDEPVLSQDGKQRVTNTWSYIKYDILGRPVYSGEMNGGTASRSSLQASADAHVQQHEIRVTSDVFAYYSDQAFPTLTGKTYTVNSATYYDDYNFDNNSATAERSFDNSFQAQFTETAAQRKPSPVYGHDGKIKGTRGLVTASRTRYTKIDNVTSDWLWSVVFYDDRERPVQAQVDNHLEGMDISTTQYHFDGRVVKTYLHHENPADATRPTVAFSQWQDYDHARRVTASYQQIDSEPVERLARYSYNELSELSSKKVGNNSVPGASSDYLQKIDFRYNIRGWLTHINNANLDTPDENDQFGMELLYNQAGATTGFNGNITGYKWKSATDDIQRAYSYKYDALSRILKADYSGAVGEDFSLYGNSTTGQNMTYDKNGNILSLYRKGLISYDGSQKPVYGEIDKLTYNYEGRGNQLLYVEDAAAANTGLAGDFQNGHKYPDNPIEEYGFDANGNLLKDENKKITGISYNYLDLPVLIQYQGNNSIEYKYDAAGGLLRKIVTKDDISRTTDYLGSFVYEENQLQFIHSAEGRVLSPALAQSNKFVYEYAYNDHQGNLRMLFKEGSTFSYKASMEPDDAASEHAQFDNVVSNDENACERDFAAKLSPGHPLGPWKTIPIRRGDKINATALAMYEAPATGNSPITLLGYLSGFNSNYPSTSPESRNSYPRLHLGIGINPTITDRPQGTPKAYLKYMFYDGQGNYIPNPGTDYDALSVGPDDCSEALEVNFTADRDGSIQVFVANESDVPVWFDQIEITHRVALNVQENHYDPFGLSLAGIEKTGNPDYKYQYNAMSEKQVDPLGKGYFYETEYRSYDPQLGRFRGVDLLADDTPGITPYQYAYNNPVMFNDPTGLSGTPVAYAIKLAEVLVTALRTPIISAGAQTALVSLGSNLAISSAISAAGGGAGGIGGCDPPCDGAQRAQVPGNTSQGYEVIPAPKSPSFRTPGRHKWLSDGFEEWMDYASEFVDGLTSIRKKNPDGTWTSIPLPTGPGAAGKGIKALSSGFRLSRIGRLNSISRVLAKIRLYPEVVDPRTGRNIPFPSDIRGIVPQNLRVKRKDFPYRSWFIGEWHRRGYPRPVGGWDPYDIHHIKPLEYGGTNDFWNLVPVERNTHKLFDRFWEKFISL